MRKQLFCAAAALAFAAAFVGCQEPEVTKKWDYPNVEIKIAAVDAQGRNLLSDLDTDGNPLPGTLRPDPTKLPDMRIEMGGETFLLRGGSSTRAEEPVLPTMYGFRLHGFRNSARLTFGEFSIDTREYRNEEFTVHWGDGTTSRARFDLYATPNGEEQPAVHSRTWLMDASGNWQVNSSNLLVLTVVK